jgi:uncharacterized protein with PIN domain
VKFIADVMVGKLARWLRVLGLDVVYSNKYDDEEIIQIAVAEDRVVLTRDSGLTKRRTKARFLLVSSDNYREQLRQVIDSFGLRDFNVFSRCLECNTLLQAVDKEDVFERIPPFVYLTQERFAICPACNRVYWHGTHANNMLKRILGRD